MAGSYHTSGRSLFAVHTVKRIRALLQQPKMKRLARVLAVIVAVALGTFAFSLSAQSRAMIGPVTIGVKLAPALDGQTTLEFPPFGRVIADTHAGPLSATARLDEVDLQQLQELAATGELPASSIEKWAGSLRWLVGRAALVGLAVGLFTACGVAWLLTHSWRATMSAAILVIALPGFALGMSWQTFDEQAFTEPTFEGALTYAPGAFALVQQKVSDIRNLQQEAGELAADLAGYYGSAQSIAPGGTLPDTVRVLHVSDLHLDPVGLQLTIDLANAYDVAFVIDSGDMAYLGSDQEGVLAAAQLSARPYIFVPGNHDSGTVVSNLAALPNVTVLDGETTVTAPGIVVLGVGDPLGDDLEYEPDAEASRRAGEEFAEMFADTPIDVAVVHAPAAGTAFDGTVPLVLSGHTHTPSLKVGDTVFENAGTTGGVHFSDLTSDPHIPNSASILYFSASEPGRLVAIDQIEVFGKTRQSSIRRTIIDESFIAGE